MMSARETKGDPNRQTLEEIVSGKKEEPSAEDDDPDPAEWVKTSYTYDVAAPYYEALTETTDGVTTAYEYGVERISEYTKQPLSTQKTNYIYDDRGSVARELTYNDSWYTFGGFLASKGVNSYTYTPFGEPLTGEGSGFRFNGEYYDSATGMVNLRARQYEPAVMRFGQRDIWHGKVEMPTTQNRYLYCVNDPVGYYDRSGNRVDEDAGRPKRGTTSRVPVVSTMPKSAYTMAQIARAEAAGNVGIDKTNLTAKQRKVVDAAERTLREKTLKGTLTEREKQYITTITCTAVKKLANPMLELPENTPYPSKTSLPQPGPSPDEKATHSKNRFEFNIKQKSVNFGLSNSNYLHTNEQDINMFYFKGSTSSIDISSYKVNIPTGVSTSFGIADVSADAFGTNDKGRTGGLNIVLLNASGYLGINSEESAGVKAEATIFKVGGFVRNEEGKKLFELNIGAGFEAGFSLTDLLPISLPKGLIIDLTIAGIPIM